jgi:hypothetical protein
MVDRFADDASGRELFRSLTLAAFDSLSIASKHTDFTIYVGQDPISEVHLYQSILINRVSSHHLLVFPADVDSRALGHEKRRVRDPARGH